MSRSIRDMLAGAGIVLAIAMILGGIVSCNENAGEVRGYYITASKPKCGEITVSIYDDRRKDYDHKIAVFNNYSEAETECDRLNVELAKK